MRLLKRIVFFVLIALLALVLIIGGWLVYLAKTRHPDLDRTVRHASLQGEVRLVRDDWGIPHIMADNEADAHFALGYAMGQDRLFQMELLRRLAKGELAEILGPPVVPVDKIARSFRLRAKAEEFLSKDAGRPPEVDALADAFVEGVNHAMDTEPLPFEYAVLGIPKRHFTKVDCMAVAAILPISFSDGLRSDPLVTVLKAKYPDLDVDALFPGYHKTASVTVMESLEECARYMTEQALTEDTAPPMPGRPGKTSYTALDEALAALGTLSRLYGPAMGSNSWILAPSRTTSGRAILANDPHIAFTNPSVWYECHMVCGDYEVYGHYLPLIFMPILGHNRHHAWGMTMFANDDVDMYRETFKEDDPNKVLFKGEWEDVRVEVEHIKVRFGEDVEYPVRITRHGPVITDLFDILHGYDKADIALQWTWQHVPYTDLLGIYKMGRATSLAEFEKGVSLLTSPGINISYVDRDDNIAWWAAGLVAIRPEHVNHKEVLDGASGKDELLGFVPFAQNPQLKNPPEGYVATANNKSTVKPVGAVRDLQGYWQPDDRVARIKELIESRDKWDIEALQKMQFDDTAFHAPHITEALVSALDTAALNDLEQRALAAWRKWDFTHGVDSIGASIYENACGTILEEALVDEIGEFYLGTYMTLADHWNFFKYFVHSPESPFWDDLRTPGKEGPKDIVTAGFKRTVAKLEEELGSDVSEWTWGRIHTMEFKHPFGYLPLLGSIFNIGPFPATGACQVINNMLDRPTGGVEKSVLAGPSTRFVIDYADPEHSVTILPTGNSGVFTSPHYDDNAAMFMAGEYREPRFTAEQIAANTKHEMRFLPAD